MELMSLLTVALGCVLSAGTQVVAFFRLLCRRVCSTHRSSNS